MGIGRDGQTDNSRDGAKQYPKTQASMDIADELLHAQLVNEDKPNRFSKDSPT